MASDEVGDSLADLERHRVRLEETIISLRKALHHWRTWDAEYEGLKEEITALPDTASGEDYAAIRDEFGGELIDQKEIDEIFGKPRFKSRDQIINLLDRRLDYVEKNVNTLDKQLEAAEENYAVASALTQPDTTDEDGQPITDIIEELDEEGNVVNFTLNTPGQALPHVREALEKAGLSGLDEIASGTQALTSENTVKEQPSPATKNVVSKPHAITKGAASTEATNSVEQTKAPISRNPIRNEDIMKVAKAQENSSTAPPVIPEDEDPEDAALRQEMLKYGLDGMGEVGAVVAELNLEEASSDEDAWDYSDEGYDDEDDDGYVITEEYAQRMLELEKKLGLKSRFTEASERATEQETASDEPADEGVGRITINRNPEKAPQRQTQPVKSSIKESTTIGAKETNKTNRGKGVRFADNLDIAPSESSAPVKPDSAQGEEKQQTVDPLSDVVERKAPPKPAEPSTSRRASRFKKGLGNASGLPKGPLDAPPEFLDHTWRETPSGPAGKTIADTLVEKETQPRMTPHDDEFDEMDMYQEVANKHERIRETFGPATHTLVHEKESSTQPSDNRTDDAKPRVSRFKAALASQK